MRALRIVVPGPNQDWASALLFEEGTAGIEVREDGPDAELVAYFEDKVDLRALTAALAAGPGAHVEAVGVPDVDWVARFRAGFAAFVAPPFRVVPVWDVPSTADPARLLVVDPGRAFGTGTHESTRLCLLALAAVAEETGLGRVLDVGTGTGILGVAALRLGARAVAAVDLDPESVASARRHATLNQASLRLVRGDGGAAFRPGSFDTVAANLSAPLLQAKAGELWPLVAPGGALVLSGFLQEDAEALRARYAGPRRGRLLADGEWRALQLRAAP
jgi:ribosomal protein L11 methyltransferase